MSSSYKPEVGDIVIPSCGKFEGLKCRVVCIGLHVVGLECLEKAEEGHKLDGNLFKPNGWWYYSSDLKYQEKNNSNFKAGDRVSSPLYPERGPGTVRKSDTKTDILVKHDDIFENGHDGDGDCPYGTAWFYNSSELTIVHESKPEPEPEPKVGDVVESKEYKQRGPGVIIGKFIGGFHVEHFKHIGTHNCRGLGKDGHCWNYLDGELILSSATKPAEPEEPISLNLTGSGSSEIVVTSGTIVGPSGSTVTTVPNNSITLMCDSYAGFGPAIWSELEFTEESKKPENSADKYIQDPIISKKAKKKKSLVIV